MARLDPAQLWKDSEKTLLRQVKNTPGLGLRELSRTTGLAPMTVGAHLHDLVDRGDLEVVIDGASHRHYLRGRIKPRPLPPELAELLQHVRDNPGLKQVELVAKFPSVARATVQHRLTRLEQRSLVERRGGVRGGYWAQ